MSKCYSSESHSSWVPLSSRELYKDVSGTQALVHESLGDALPVVEASGGAYSTLQWPAVSVRGRSTGKNVGSWGHNSCSVLGLTMVEQLLLAEAHHGGAAPSCRASP